MKYSSPHLILATLVFLICSCKEPAKYVKVEPGASNIETKQIQPKFYHMVYLYFKEDMPDSMRSKFMTEAMKEMSTIPQLVLFEYGQPAMTDRNVVDNSYDVGLMTAFASKADHDAYQIHPIHLKFVEEYKTYFKEVKVYDTLID